MLLKKVNCDEDTAKTNEMCAKARKLLEDMEANNEAIHGRCTGTNIITIQYV